MKEERKKGSRKSEQLLVIRKRKSSELEAESEKEIEANSARQSDLIGRSQIIISLPCATRTSLFQINHLLGKRKV